MPQNKIKVLHLSHTDIRYDSRILKEMDAVSQVRCVQVHGLGIELDEGSAVGNKSTSMSIESVSLFTKVFNKLPRSVRYSLNFLELFFKFLFKGLWFRPSIVHCHDTLVLPIGVILKLLTGASLIYDAHELESDKNGQSKYLSKGTLFIERLFWRPVDLFITVSESISKWYEDNLGVKNSIVILNSPVKPEPNASTDKYSSSYLRDRYQINADEKVFVYLGILASGRGIELCLDTFSQLSNSGAHVVFAGYGPLKDKIVEWSTKYDNIHFHPAVPHEDVVPLIKSADVGLCFVENVSLSDYYCLPNKLFEYCFAGLPVLASRLPEIEKVVQKYNLGICADPSVDSMKAAVQNILHASSYTFSRDINQLSWDTQATLLHDAYIRLLAQRGLL